MIPATVRLMDYSQRFEKQIKDIQEKSEKVKMDVSIRYAHARLYVERLIRRQIIQMQSSAQQAQAAA